MKAAYHNLWIFLSFGCFLVIGLGLPVDVMDVDASQYASISKEMEESGNYLQVLHRGRDYLDKPPLLFWTSALSFHLFGYSNIAYKLFSFLALLLGFLSIYRFVLLLYTKRAAQISTLLYSSNIAILLIGNDVRTDTLLLGFCTFAVWQAAAYIKKAKLIYLIGFGIGSGIAMLAKGPIGLMLPLAAIGTHLIINRQWKQILDPGWLISLFIIGLILFPMAWGLFQQFDLQPEKVINGKTGVSGLYFYFWEQSFGRLTGQSDWKDDSSYFYFFHTFLWAFVPWIFAFVLAVWSSVKASFSKLKNAPILKDGYIPGAIIIPFIALSFSHYKLPHYIFIIVPFASALTGIYLDWLVKYHQASVLRWIRGFQSSIFLVSIFFAFAISVFAFPGGNHLFFWFSLAGIIVIFIWAIFKIKRLILQILIIGTLSFLLIGSTMNLIFYPNLLTYQSSSQIGKWIAQNVIDASQIYAFQTHPHAVDFYSGRILNEFDSIGAIETHVESNDKPTMIYTNDVGRNELKRSGFQLETLLESPHFKVTKLSLKFLNPQRRPESLSKTYIIRIIPQ
jgi:4-amino-4-deoxy-L-arabinose transferase-like glycosyltransferase